MQSHRIAFGDEREMAGTVRAGQLCVRAGERFTAAATRSRDEGIMNTPVRPKRNGGREVMRRAFAIVLATYALHFAWEMGQASLFARMDRLPFWTATAWCARAAGWDVVIGAAAFSAAALAGRRALWIQRRAWWPFAIYFAVGLGVTIAIERWAIAVGRWQYRDAMPTIAGIGLTPLVQWIVVPATILVVVRWVTRH